MSSALKSFATALITLALQADAQTSYQKTEFQTKNLRPPIWMVGEYYVVTEGDSQYLYVIPSLYTKIAPDNDFRAENGRIFQLYAQFESEPRLAAGAPLKPKSDSEESQEAPYYESWTCNMRFFSDVSDKDQEDLNEVFFYEGYNQIAAQGGTYKSTNGKDKVEKSAWKNDSELTLIKESNENALGDKFTIFQCGMYRAFKDEYSQKVLKIGDEMPWLFGYRVYRSLGSF